MARPFIPAPLTASIEFIYLWNGIICENVVHVTAVEEFTPESLLTLWTTAHDWWNSSWRTNVHNTLSLTRIRVKALYAPDAPMLDESVIPSIAGLNSSFRMPNNVTFAIKLATGLAGRSSRGRWYVAGLHGDAVASGTTIVLGYANSYVFSLLALKSALAAAGFTLVVTSFRNNKQWRAEAVSHPVSGILFTDVNLDSQRRRLAGRGK